jgi:hypothetical protein
LLNSSSDRPTWSLDMLLSEDSCKKNVVLISAFRSNEQDNEKSMLRATV